MTDSRYSLGLFTDFYELTMAQAYWHSRQTASATFSLYFRGYPRDRAYYVVAGLEAVLNYLETCHFSTADMAYLRSLKRFDGAFLDYLAGLHFSGSVRATPEGTIAFAGEPVLEVSGPVIEAQLVETYLLNQVTLQTILATKASRVVHAAEGADLGIRSAGVQLIDFAARRAQGIGAAHQFARAAYMVGFDGTSNTLAGSLYGIPVSGTMAHSFVTSFPSEIEAFRQYARSFPDSSTFLVDTFDTVEGTKNAATVGQDMKARGQRLHAIRLDSGDMLDLARRCRAILNEAGLPEVQIFASGGLDEYSVEELVLAGAPIDGFGVGTRVGVSADAPYADSVYKLVEYAGRPVLKLSTGKRTLPGSQQVFRFRDSFHAYLRDVIGRAGEQPVGGEALLAEVMRAGKRLRADPPLEELRRRFRAEFGCLPERHKALRSPAHYEVQVSPELEALREKVAQEAQGEGPFALRET
jgi:nicotinate phosphoribosyltransferase